MTHDIPKRSKKKKISPHQAHIFFDDIYQQYKTKLITREKIKYFDKNYFITGNM